MATIFHFCKYPLLASMLAIASINCDAQAPKLLFKHIAAEQGLSNSTVEIIFQDSRGFMWFGTRDGLNRYDGYRTTVYRYDANDTTTISDNYITSIFEDDQHILWVGTINGLNGLNIAKNKFTRYKHRPGDTSTITQNHITSILQDKKGNLWIGTFGGGLNLLNARQRSFRNFRYTGDGTLSPDRVQCILEDRSGQLWLGTENGLHLFLPLERKFIFYPSSTNNGVRNLQEGKSGYLWLGTEEQGLLRFDPKLRQFASYKHAQTVPGSLGSNQVRSVLADKKGNLWVGGINGGLNLLDTSTNSFYNYQNTPGDPWSLSQRTVSAIYEDNQGNLWVGTHRGGVNLSTRNTNRFPLFRQEANKNSVSYNDVRTFCEENDHLIWIGTDGGGLNLFNRQNQRFVHFLHNPYDQKSIGSNEVLHVLKDSKGNIWISTWGGGLNLLKAGSSSFERFMNDPSNPASISSNYVQKTFEDHNKNLWVATYYGGLNLLDAKTKSFTRMIASGDGRTQLQGNNVVSIDEDRKGNLWIGTDDGGLNRYNPALKTFSHYFNTQEKPPDLRVLFNDSKGRLWVGQAGLYVFDERTDHFSLATTSGGLATEFIKGIAEDPAGNFWISTSNGLTTFNPATGTYKKFNSSDGLQGLEFEANAYLQTKDGQLFFGGVNGFNSFYPGQIEVNSFVPPVWLTELQVFNQLISPTAEGPLTVDVGLAKEIKLTYRQSDISFGFAALNFSAAENNQYAYRLEGLQNTWNYAGTERKASYTNLNPGTYTFRVKASNNDGVWNDEGTAIKIIITPPFWKTWWFTALAIMVFFAGIVSYYQFRRKQEIKQMEERKREEIHEMQLQFFTNISHEFRTPLTLIVGPLEKLQKENNQPEVTGHYRVMQRNAQRLLELINELMDFRKAATGSLKLKVMPGNLPLFLKEIEEEFHDLAQEKKMHLHICVPETMDELWFDRQVLEKIMINLVSNSFKYSPDGGNISVEVFESMKNFQPSFTNELIIKNDYRPKRSICLRVADSGIGISKESIQYIFERYYRITDAHMGSGVGLAFVKSLTLLHKGSIFVYSERGKGTEIIVCLPVGSSDYSPEDKWINVTPDMTPVENKHHKYPAISGNGPIAEKKNTSGMGSQKQCVLVVDDNHELKTFITGSLQPFYMVVGAKDGMEGLQQAKEIMPDLIISDVMMPVMDGIEFCKRLKEDSALSHIPFMMLTAKDTLVSRLEGTGSGADHYFSKPLSMELLLLTIRNIFEQKQKLKERYLNEHHAEAKELAHSASDKAFMNDLLAIIDEQLTNPELDVELICKSIGMSRTKLYQKIKTLTGQSINDFIRTIRLRKAVEIMTHEDVSMADIIFRVGIQTHSYFTKAFKKELGKTPSQFLQDLKK